MSNKKWDDIKARKRQLMIEYHLNSGKRITSREFVKFITLYKYLSMFYHKFRKQKELSDDMAAKIKSAYRMQYRLLMRIKKEGPTTIVRVKRKLNS